MTVTKDVVSQSKSKTLWSNLHYQPLKKDVSDFSYSPNKDSVTIYMTSKLN